MFYVIGVFDYVKFVGVKIGVIFCNVNVKILVYVDIVVEVVIGVEILIGFIRLKVGIV